MWKQSWAVVNSGYPGFHKSLVNPVPGRVRCQHLCLRAGWLLPGRLTSYRTVLFYRSCGDACWLLPQMVWMPFCIRACFSVTGGMSRTHEYTWPGLLFYSVWFLFLLNGTLNSILIQDTGHYTSRFNGCLRSWTVYKVKPRCLMNIEHAMPTRTLLDLTTQKVCYAFAVNDANLCERW